jgi:cell division protein FtsN
MVGRGVEGGAAGAGETRAVAEERVVPEPSATAAASPGPSDYTYPQRLETERPEEGLEKPRPGGAAAAPTAPPTRPTPAPARATPATKAVAPAAAPTPTPAPTTLPTPPPVGARPAALPRALASTAPGFAIQVGAFKDRGSADGVVKSLKARGLPAYVVTPTGGGLFTVRVGVYRDRADAEAVQERLRDDKFRPYIIKQ